MSANGQRCWEYLSSRLAEINQLRSEDDEQEPILVSKLNCLQVRVVQQQQQQQQLQEDGVGSTVGAAALPQLQQQDGPWRRSCVAIGFAAMVAGQAQRAQQWQQHFKCIAGSHPFDCPVALACAPAAHQQAQNLLPALAATLPCHGPIAVVYPEGVWYDRLTPLVLERIIEEHLLGGHTVSGHVMMGSRAADHDPHVLPALDITRCVC
jgi:(2Fe-2S) ferredoxin